MVVAPTPVRELQFPGLPWGRNYYNINHNHKPYNPYPPHTHTHGDPHTHGRPGSSRTGVRKPLCEQQEGYIFYAGESLAGAGYCRQCRRRPAILPLQLWQGCHVCVKRVAQFYVC